MFSRRLSLPPAALALALAAGTPPGAAADMLPSSKQVPAPLTRQLVLTRIRGVPASGVFRGIGRLTGYAVDVAPEVATQVVEAHLPNATPLYRVLEVLEEALSARIEVDGATLRVLPVAEPPGLGRVVKLDMKDVPARKVLEVLARFAEVGVAVDDEVAARRVELHVQDISIREALDAVAAQLGARWSLRGGVVVVTAS